MLELRDDFFYLAQQSQQKQDIVYVQIVYKYSNISTL